jgi:hypothetical protein
MKVKPYVKACERDKGKGKAGDQLYFYPPGQEDPSPMYEGLKTNLPYVSGSARPLAKVCCSAGMASGERKLTVLYQDLMSFRDLPYPDHSALFPDRGGSLSIPTVEAQR